MFLCASDGSRFTLKLGDNILGRSRSKCDVHLTEVQSRTPQAPKDISSTHACIHISQHSSTKYTATIRDLQSRSGTFFSYTQEQGSDSDRDTKSRNDTERTKVTTSPTEINERMSLHFGNLPISFKIENSTDENETRPQSPTLSANDTARSQSSLDSTTLSIASNRKTESEQFVDENDDQNSRAVQAWKNETMGSPLSSNGSIISQREAFKHEIELQEGRKRAACEIMWRILETRALMKRNRAMGVWATRIRNTRAKDSIRRRALRMWVKREQRITSELFAAWQNEIERKHKARKQLARVLHRTSARIQRHALGKLRSFTLSTSRKQRAVLQLFAGLKRAISRRVGNHFLLWQIHMRKKNENRTAETNETQDNNVSTPRHLVAVREQQNTVEKIQMSSNRLLDKLDSYFGRRNLKRQLDKWVKCKTYKATRRNKLLALHAKVQTRTKHDHLLAFQKWMSTRKLAVKQMQQRHIQTKLHNVLSQWNRKVIENKDKRIKYRRAQIFNQRNTEQSVFTSWAALLFPTRLRDPRAGVHSAVKSGLMCARRERRHLHRVFMAWAELGDQRMERAQETETRFVKARRRRLRHVIRRWRTNKHQRTNLRQGIVNLVARRDRHTKQVSFEELRQATIDNKRHRIRLTQHMDKRDRSILCQHLCAWTQQLNIEKRNNNIIQRRIVNRMQKTLSEIFQEWAHMSNYTQIEKQEKKKLNDAMEAANQLEDSFSEERNEKNTQLTQFVDKQKNLALRRVMHSCRLRLTERGWRTLVAFTRDAKAHNSRIQSAHRLYAKVMNGTIARAFEGWSEWADTRIKRRNGLVAITIRVRHRREIDAFEYWRENMNARIRQRDNIKWFVLKMRNREVARALQAWKDVLNYVNTERRMKEEARESYVSNMAFRAWKGQVLRRRQLVQKAYRQVGANRHYNCFLKWRNCIRIKHTQRKRVLAMLDKSARSLISTSFIKWQKYHSDFKNCAEVVEVDTKARVALQIAQSIGMRALTRGLGRLLVRIPFKQWWDVTVDTRSINRDREAEISEEEEEEEDKPLTTKQQLRKELILLEAGQKHRATIEGLETRIENMSKENENARLMFAERQRVWHDMKHSLISQIARASTGGDDGASATSTEMEASLQFVPQEQDQALPGFGGGGGSGDMSMPVPPRGEGKGAANNPVLKQVQENTTHSDPALTRLVAKQQDQLEFLEQFMSDHTLIQKQAFPVFTNESGPIQRQQQQQQLQFTQQLSTQHNLRLASENVHMGREIALQREGMESHLKATQRKYQNKIRTLTRAYSDASRRDSSLVETMKTHCKRMHRELVRLAVPSAQGQQTRQAALQLLNVQLLAALQREANLQVQLGVLLKKEKKLEELEKEVEPGTNMEEKESSKLIVGNNTDELNDTKKKKNNNDDTNKNKKIIIDNGENKNSESSSTSIVKPIRDPKSAAAAAAEIERLNARVEMLLASGAVQRQMKNEELIRGLFMKFKHSNNINNSDNNNNDQIVDQRNAEKLFNEAAGIRENVIDLRSLPSDDSNAREEGDRKKENDMDIIDPKRKDSTESTPGI